jgi:hypothetical protein
MSGIAGGLLDARIRSRFCLYGEAHPCDMDNAGSRAVHQFLPKE